MISISIVSHGQMAMVESLLADLQRECGAKSIEVILTLNTPNECVGDLSRYSFSILVIQNELPQGFGANHNQAFRISKGEYFCVVNPDVRLKCNPFDLLVACLGDYQVGVAAPVVLNGEGGVEDSARDFPSPIAIFCKIIGIRCKQSYVGERENIYPDWVAGMFMLFRMETYKALKGFDERYFLYYEDVDVCARLTNMGKKIVLCSCVNVVHLAQRTSHRNFKYLRWHVTSMLRFFLSLAYWRLVWR